jgi:hypothetical protein
VREVDVVRRERLEKVVADELIGERRRRHGGR